jgi:hypothetical protein
LYISAVFKSLGPAAKRDAILTWLQDQIVPLVGPDAAAALGALLHAEGPKADALEKWKHRVDAFVEGTLKFQTNLERGLETPDDAVDEWRRKQDPGQFEADLKVALRKIVGL